MNAKVFPDLLGRDAGFTVPCNTHDVITELSGVGFWHDAILPGRPSLGRQIRCHLNVQQARKAAGAAKARGEQAAALMPRVPPHDLRQHSCEPCDHLRRKRESCSAHAGHASASMTLDTYADFFGDIIDDVAHALDQAKRLATGF